MLSSPGGTPPWGGLCPVNTCSDPLTCASLAGRPLSRSSLPGRRLCTCAVRDCCRCLRRAPALPGPVLFPKRPKRPRKRNLQRKNFNVITYELMGAHCSQGSSCFGNPWFPGRPAFQEAARRAPASPGPVTPAFFHPKRDARVR